MQPVVGAMTMRRLLPQAEKQDPKRQFRACLLGCQMKGEMLYWRCGGPIGPVWFAAAGVLAGAAAEGAEAPDAPAGAADPVCFGVERYPFTPFFVTSMTTSS